MVTSLRDDLESCGCTVCREELTRIEVESDPEVVEVELLGNRVEVRFFPGTDPRFSELIRIAERFGRNQYGLERHRVTDAPTLVMY